MKQRYLGRTGLKVSRLGLGTWTWGTDVDEAEAAGQLRAFVAAGGTLIDTASSYGRGASEVLIGSLLTSGVERDDVVIATKAGICETRGELVQDTSRGAMLRTLDGSLRRLGVDHIDLWQVHLASNRVPVEETLSALDAAVSSGRVRYVGICNYSGWQTAQAATHQSCSPGRVRLASTQMEYSLLQRGIEREVVPAAQALGLGILPWSPLGRGVLTGKYRTGVPTGSRGASDTFADYVAEFLNPQAARIVEAVCRAAEGLDLSPTQVALAWVRDQPGVTAPIVGARTASQLTDSLRSESVVLPAEIADALDDVSAPVLGYPEA
ncbi:MAG: aldo/keto reductase [Propionibacteriales bacterium]|nr:aldo/keto reductase [Propionibacteriales bacterium]